MRKIFFCFICSISMLAHAQPGTISFDHLLVENGLPENYGIDIREDGKGYIWFGTQKGIVRFDGYNVKVYKQHLLNANNTHLNSITSIFVDKDGCIWAGTLGNYLLKYQADSDNFRIYQPDSAINAFTSSIFNIVEDVNANLWLKTYDHIKDHYYLQRFDRETGKFILIKMKSEGGTDIPADIPIEIFSDKTGRVWVATENGFYTTKEKTNKFIGHFVSADPLHKRIVNNFYEPPSEPGIVYMSNVEKNGGKFTPSGIMRYVIEKDQWTVYTHHPSEPNSLQNDTIVNFFEDKKKRLWIGTNNGLIYFDRQNDSFKYYDPGTGDSKQTTNDFETIRQDSRGGLWLAGGTDLGQGLTYFDPDKKVYTRYHADNSRTDALASNIIEQLYADRSGNIWLAFRNSGVQRINWSRSRFTVYTHIPENSSSYPGGSVNSFAEDSNGIYWLGTKNGLVKNIPGNGFEKINLFGETPGNAAAVWALMKNKEDKLWFVYQGKGLIHFDPKTGAKKNYLHNDRDSLTISSNDISCLYEDHEGTIWVGTGSGLCRFNRETQNFTRYPYFHNSNSLYTGKALDDGNVTSIFEDEKSRLWVGTNLGGLNLMNKEKGTFTAYYDEPGGIGNIVSIQPADSGRLWLGSYLLGVSLFDPGLGRTVRTFNEKNGLLCDVVAGSKTDADGNLWVCTLRGLAMINHKTFSITNYTAAQGLPANTLSFPPFLDQKGFLFAGFKSGFFVFSPEDMRPSQTLATINLEAIDAIKTRNAKNYADTFLVNGRTKIALEYDQNKLEFHFTGIQYENSPQNTYTYRLEGYDKEWIFAGISRSATYTNLSPGTYTFFVKAANLDGVWNETPASLVIVIHPPWWITWWAWMIYVFILGALVRALVAYRSRNLKRENKILEEKISHRTELLQKSLENLKSTQSQLIQSEKMASLGELTAGIAHEIQNPLNFVNNFSEVSEELIVEMEQELENGDTGEAKMLAEEIRQNLQKINHHGKRADSIVKGMLQHSRTSTGQKELTDLNALADEYLRLAYHGMRSKDNSFNATLITDFDEKTGKINIIPQDIGRVLLNLYNNAFYAASEKAKSSGGDYKPTITVGTRQTFPPPGGSRGAFIEISVKDNGPGIPQKILDKIFQPFFTTKPTGQGTGLGLSLSYDIVKAHGGEIDVKTNEGGYTEFIIQLPVV